MISLETESKIAELLYEILIGERKVEEARFTLSRHREFELSCAFKELDRIGMGSLSSTDIRYFLEKNRIECTTEEAYLVIRQYDKNSDGRLSITEFSRLVLPNTLPMASDAKGNYSRLTIDAEYLLTKLLETEVKFQRSLELIRKDLIERKDFNLMEGFRCLDKRSQSHIDDSALYIFLRRNGFSVVEMDMQHILNRIDRDQDGEINYVEFVDSVLPSEPHTRIVSPIKRDTTPLKVSNSYARSNGSPYQSISVRNFSPLRSSPLRSSMLYPQSSSTMKEINLNISSPSKSYSNKTSSIEDYSNSYHSSPLKNPSGDSQAFNARQKPFKTVEEKEIIACFSEEIKVSKEIEAFKNELSLKADFNLIDAFRMFDMNDRGMIDISDIQNFIKDYTFYVDPEEIYLFIRHFSRMQDGKLRFSDFTEIFTPGQEDYARLLRNRSGYSLSGLQRRCIFSRETLNLFIETLKLIFNSESNSERLRQRLARIPNIKIQDAFVAIDRNGDGFINVDELKSILDEYKVFPNSNDLKNLMLRYDKNKDGRVSFTEFVQEITPKSPKKY
jgi:Ca2+-binding EF-hand superfamily protein